MISDAILNKAVEIAESSSFHKQVGAILLAKGKVVETGVNIRKTHPTQAKWAIRAGLPEKIYLHAEMAALVRCKEDADTIVVARVNRQGKLRNAKPCPICRLALEQAGVTQVCYSTDEGFLYEFH